MANRLPLLALLALCVPIAGSIRPLRVKTSPPPIALEAMRFYAAGQYAEAASRFESAYPLALAANDYPLAISLLNNLASCRMIGFRYREAMRWLTESRDLAQRIGDKESEGVIQINLGQLYALMGDYARAIEAVTPIVQLSWLARWKSPILRQQRGLALTILANAHHRLAHRAEAWAAFEAAIAEARRRRAIPALALALDHYGLALLEAGEVGKAARLIEESASLRRREAPNSIGMSERSLGRLRLAEGRFAEALPLIESALARQKSGLQLTPIFNLYADRALAHQGLGQDEAALSDFREAMRWVRRWRLDLLPVAGLEAAWEADLHRLRSAYIDLAAGLSAARQDRNLAWEALVAAEESRAHALRESRRGGARLPPEYAEKALQLQQIESALLAGGDTPARRQQAKAIEQRLVELETAAGYVAEPIEPRLLPKLPAPAPKETRFSYFLGEKNSWRWELTSSSLSVKRLAPASRLQALAERFRQEVRDGAELRAGAELYAQIFGEISPVTLTNTTWSIVPDGALFAVPFAALPVARGPVYLIEERTLRVISSALLPPVEAKPVAGSLVAVADPVYNEADARWPAAGGSGLQLPRLVASGAEAVRVSQAWGGQARVLSGPQATQKEVLLSLRQPTTVLHLATHFLESADGRQTYIAFGRGPGSPETELFGPEVIHTLETLPALVVLNGCQSARGQVLAGTGLSGLTRAWLAAGAREVAASHWPVHDDQGELFVRMYQHLRRRRDGMPAAAALREAQLEMLRSSDWRREPRYWSAFFVMSKG